MSRARIHVFGGWFGGLFFVFVDLGLAVVVEAIAWCIFPSQDEGLLASAVKRCNPVSLRAGDMVLSFARRFAANSVCDGTIVIPV